MRAEDLHAFTRRQPFVPFRIHSTDSRSYDVWHPDQVIPMRSRVIVGVGGEKSPPDAVEHLSLIHVVRLEEIDVDLRHNADRK
jgi:hypothetical protein